MDLVVKMRSCASRPRVKTLLAWHMLRRSTSRHPRGRRPFEQNHLTSRGFLNRVSGKHLLAPEFTFTYGISKGSRTPDLAPPLHPRTNIHNPQTTAPTPKQALAQVRRDIVNRDNNRKRLNSSNYRIKQNYTKRTLRTDTVYSEVCV